MPTLKTIYDSYPEPKSTYQTFTKRLRNNKKEIDAIMPERQSKNSTTTIKRLYESYPQPKCSYVRFCLRIRKGFTPEQAIVLPRVYKKNTRTVESIQEEIKNIINEKEKYREYYDKYCELQREKDRLVRILSVYKNK